MKYNFQINLIVLLIIGPLVNYMSYMEVQMKIIKEDNLNHEIFKEYNNHTNILEIFRFESPEGYMIIRRSGKRFAIDIYGAASIELTTELKEILVPYFKGDILMSLDKSQNDLKEYIEHQGIKYWFSTYNMSIDSIKEMTEGKIVPYNGELERYIHIYGKSYIPLREELGFEVADNCESDPAWAKKDFEESNKTGSFYGYVVNDKIIGVAFVDDNEIDEICIDPEYQGKGYGRQLLRGVVSNLLSKFDKVILGVVEINRKAYNLYESEGFKVTSYLQNYKNYVA